MGGSRIDCPHDRLHPADVIGLIKRDEIDRGELDGVSIGERERIKAREREVKELRRANEILNVASAFFA